MRLSPKAPEAEENKVSATIVLYIRYRNKEHYPYPVSRHLIAFNLQLSRMDNRYLNAASSSLRSTTKDDSRRKCKTNNEIRITTLVALPREREREEERKRERGTRYLRIS